jgi:transposase
MLKLRGKKIYLACGFTDMRKGIEGLAALVELSFELNPYEDAIFVFCNKNRDRLKMLEWDGDGYGLYLKRLEKGRFKWPSTCESGTISLSGDELELLLESAKLSFKIRRKEVNWRISA